MRTTKAAAIGTGVLAGLGAGLALFSQWEAKRAEAAAPPDGRFIEVDGARLHYVEVGSGPPVVMVHGLGGQLRNFTYSLAERLAARHRLIIVDRPRSGYSTAAPGTEPGIREQGRIIARFITALGLERPLLVGHSLGGAVSLALALDHPGLVRGLALLAPLSQPQDTVPLAFQGLAARSPIVRGLIANVLGVPLGKAAGALTTALIFSPEPAPADFAIRGGGALALRPGNLDAASFELSSAETDMPAIAARYGELTLPVSILYGRGDALLDYQRDGEATAAAIAGAHLELIEGGHMMLITQPDRTAAFIEAAARRSA